MRFAVIIIIIIIIVVINDFISIISSMAYGAFRIKLII